MKEGIHMHGKASKELQKEVIDKGLCTLCGGCTGTCPYLVVYDGRIVRLHRCDMSEGQCYHYCPRTYMDMDAISRHIFGAPYGEGEIGSVREVFLARSTDQVIHQKAQDGGIVTTLLSVALAEGMIDGAVETKLDEEKNPHGFIARNREELLECAGVSYEPSPVIQAINRLPNETTEKLGFVGLPCHVACLSKMKLSPPTNRANIEHLEPVIGLFCGWTLSHSFHRFLQEHFNLAKAIKFDIPHHPEHTFDVYTPSGKESVDLDEISPYINKACGYCFDMTAEFADISVGSGRAMFKGWNTVILRTKVGAEILDIAKGRNAIEIQPIPDESLANLKRASLDKKKRALKNIISMTGGVDDLLYLGISQHLKEMLLE
ncbi:MAG: Coenzyme F420 hydrogenase/dehydrogenase, beta subunit C-terminal domain [Deltaproteobacteria bacterium]|nr:Coenzyme F420 hydrogenase/dehydrogenase, beta subunit C-terminal domain [Deltaproteobacteria bacterium]